MKQATRLPPGHQPYDPLNAIRIGGLTGALLGAGVSWGIGFERLWLVAASAVIGGFVAHRWERRHRPEA